MDVSRTACKERIQLGDHARVAREVYQICIPSGFRGVSRAWRVMADVGLEANRQSHCTIDAGAEQLILASCLLVFPADQEQKKLNEPVVANAELL